MTTTTLSAVDAAKRIVALLNTPVLAEANAALAETGNIGLWIDAAFAARSRVSSGEEVLINLVLFVFNGGGSASLHDLTTLDSTLMAKVLDIIHARFVGTPAPTPDRLFEATRDLSGRLSDAVDAAPYGDPTRAGLLEADRLVHEAKRVLHDTALAAGADR